ncbi:translocation/assembly module TamB domain-containing protein [uncultured Endozoicomonas sp.]|uniref:autotransporter assembly complex protein TamB n=1 Tax=uncultured Endozoicomonas sp. TaxID=432652 RepID=UPI0026338C0D|nr:translocation/assembly module TamB domain-containing protein [uncultured Endozoicomonas sp.]
MSSDPAKAGPHAFPDKKAKRNITLATRITSVLLGLVAVILCLFSLLVFTQSGNALIWRQLAYSISPLNGEFVKGELLSGWTLNNLTWTDHQTRFNADEAILEWHFAKLLNRELPIQLIRLKNTRLIINNIPEKVDVVKTEPEADSPFKLPFNLRVDQIYLDNFTLQSPKADLSVGILHSVIQLKNNRLTIPELIVDQFHLKIKPTEQTPPSAIGSFSLAKGIDLSKTNLPRIQTPIPITLDRFLLTNASLENQNVKESLQKLELGLTWDDSEIKNLSAALKSPKIDAQLIGTMQLSDNYPSDINLEATLYDNFNIAELNGIKDEQLTLKTSGNLNLLTIDVKTRGLINAEIQGTISPLKPQIPMNLRISWQNLKWPPLADAPQLISDFGSVHLFGKLDQYQLTIDAALHAIDQPEAHLKLISNGNLETLSINELSANPVDTTNKETNAQKAVNITGMLNWKNGIQWQGKVQLSQLTPELWLPGIPGTLNGTLQSQFSLQNEKWQLQLSDMDVNGTLLNQPASAKGKLKATSIRSSSYALPFTATANNLHLSLGDNQLDVHGTLAEKVALRAEINAQTLGLLHQDLAGQLQGNINVSGTSQQPSLSYSINSSRFVYQQTSITGLKATGNLTKGKVTEGRAKIGAVALNHGALQLNDFSLTASGDELKHIIAIKTAGNPIGGELTFNGSWKDNQWNADIPEALLATPVDKWTLEKPVSIQLNRKQIATISDQCWLSSPAKLCIGRSHFSPNQATTSFVLSDLDLSTLGPLFPNTFNWEAKLSGNGELQWIDGIPKANVRLKTTPGKLINKSAASIIAEYQQLNASINLDSETLTAKLDFLSKVLGTAQLNLSVSDIQRQQQLSGTADIQSMQLTFLQPLIPELSRLDGLLSMNTRMAGTLKEPLLYGKLQLSDGNAITRGDTVRVSSLKTQLAFEGDHARINGSLKVGDGDMQLSGDMNWQQQPLRGQLTMKGKDLEARYPGILQLKASPDLTINLGDSDTLSGTVHIPWARVQVKQLPKQAVKPSDDVVIVTSESTTKTNSATTLSMNVNIVLGNDIKIDAYGLKANLAGHLRINQQPEKPLTGNGSIQLLKGRYHQFGQDLLIKEGDIIFSGPLSSPYLAVNAIRNPDSIEGNVTVGVQVSGPPDQPQFTIYSDPAMAQEEQWSYLLRGHGLKGDDNSAVQAMLISFGVSQFGGVVTTLGKAVGISDVTLATQGSGDDTQVTIGGTLAPGLRVQYGAGVFNSIAELKVRYELMPRLYLQAVSGVAQAVDLFYQFKIQSNDHDPLSMQ